MLATSSAQHASVRWKRAKRGRRTDERFLILDFCRDTTFVMGRYEWDWEGGGRTAQFRNSLNCLSLSSSPVWRLQVRLLSLSSFSNLNPAFTRIRSKSSLIAGLAATHAAGGARDSLLSCSSRMASPCNVSKSVRTNFYTDFF